MLEIGYKPLQLSLVRFHISINNVVSESLLGFLKTHITKFGKLIVSKLFQFKFSKHLIHFISSFLYLFVIITSILHLISSFLHIWLSILTLTDCFCLLRFLDLVNQSTHILLILLIPMIFNVMVTNRCRIICRLGAVIHLMNKVWWWVLFLKSAHLTDGCRITSRLSTIMIDVLV